MVKFRGVSNNEMTLYLLIDHTETAVWIACDMCKGTTNVEKPTEFLYIQSKVSCVQSILSIKIYNYIYILKISLGKP